MYLLMFWVELVKYFLLIHYSLKFVKEEMIFVLLLHPS